jgi:hypothetical protein
MTKHKKPNLLYRIKTFIYAAWARYECEDFPLIQEAWFRVLIGHKDGGITGSYNTDIKDDKEIVGYKWRVQLCELKPSYSNSPPYHTPGVYVNLITGYTETEKAARLRVMWYTWYYRLDQIFQIAP